MANINLLPWREKKREHLKNQFFIMLGGAFIIAIIILFGYYEHINTLVDEHRYSNQLLTDEINRFDLQIKEISQIKGLKQSLISRMRVIYQLKSTRPITVHLFDEIINVLPQGVYLTKIERFQRNVTMYGFSESNTNISRLMKTIQKNSWIDHPKLTEIKKNDSNNNPINNEFKLSFNLREAS